MACIYVVRLYLDYNGGPSSQINVVLIYIDHTRIRNSFENAPQSQFIVCISQFIVCIIVLYMFRVALFGFLGVHEQCVCSKGSSLDLQSLHLCRTRQQYCLIRPECLSHTHTMRQTSTGFLAGGWLSLPDNPPPWHETVPIDDCCS